MDRISVVSSNVRSVGYSPENHTLEIEFQNGDIYQYQNVSQINYERFLSAPSKGSFVHEHLKDRYPTRKIN